jgi:hypothetical protein
MPPALERRFAPIVVAILGGLLLLLRGAVFEGGGGSVPVACVALGPLFVLLGLAGLVDPRVIDSLGPRRRAQPLAVRVASVACVVVSLGLSAALVLLHWY